MEKIYGKYSCKKNIDRFELIYRYYNVFDEIIDMYKEGLRELITSDKEYNNISDATELGVRIMTTLGVSDTTQAQALENIEIDDAIENEVYSDIFFKDIDDPDGIRFKIREYNLMKSEYKLFSKRLKKLDKEEYIFLLKFMKKEDSVEDIADEYSYSVDYTRKKISQTKNKLKNIVIPFMR